MVHSIDRKCTWTLDEILDLVGDVDYSDVYVWSSYDTDETVVEYPPNRIKEG